MSRSIHDTHVVAALEWKTAVRKNTDEAWARAEAVRANIHRQRSIRRRVRQTRGRDEPLSVTADTVPILRWTEDPGVYHGAHEGDLREVMRRLPPGSLDGLGFVELRTAALHRARSPFVGVVAPHHRGSYREEDRGIRIHAFEK